MLKIKHKQRLMSKVKDVTRTKWINRNKNIAELQKMIYELGLWKMSTDLFKKNPHQTKKVMNSESYFPNHELEEKMMKLTLSYPSISFIWLFIVTCWLWTSVHIYRNEKKWMKLKSELAQEFVPRLIKLQKNVVGVSIIAEVWIFFVINLVTARVLNIML